MIVKRFLPILLVLLALLPLLLAAPEPYETDNPYPTFSVTYDEANAPITINSVSLEDEYNNFYTLTATGVYPLTDPWKFNFTSAYYLPDNQYEFILEATDVNGNPRQDIFLVDVDVDSMPIYVVSPLSPLFSDSENQDFAVGSELPFTLVLETAAEVTCRIKANSLSGREPADEWQSAATAFNEGSLIESTRHEIEVVANSQGSNTVLEARAMNYNHLFTNMFLVVCQQRVGSGHEYYSKVIHVGYDSTPPQVSMDFSPDLVIDYSDVTTVLNISSTGDLMSCAYSLDRPDDNVDRGNIPSPLESFSDLFSQTTENFSFNDEKTLFGFGNRFNFDLTTNCTNPAGLSTITTDSFAIELSTVLRLDMEETHFSTSKPELTLTTNLASSCWYEENDTVTDLVSTDGLSHSFSGKTFEEGSTNMLFSCRSDQGIIETRTFTIVIDSVKPLMPVIGSGKDHCENRLSVLINAPNPEDTIRYNFSLYNSSTTTANYMILEPDLTGSTDEDLLIEAPLSLRTKQNSSYTWLITPIDEAGNVGPSVKHTVTKVSPDSISCDVTSPIATSDIIEIPTGYEINISCKDAESGCTNSFKISQILLNETCNYSEGVITPYTANPLTITSNKTICYTVSDLAGNNKSKQFDLIVNIEQELASRCSNGIQDLTEEGIDCGGVCGTDKPCPEKKPDTYTTGDNESEDSLETEDTEPEVECYTDFDCAGLDMVCVDNECVYSTTSTTGPSMLGLILLILGLLLMGGGIGYIVYTEKQKQEYSKQKAMHTQMSAEESAALAAKRLADEKKYLEELKKKRELGNAKKAKLSEEKKSERSKLLGSFEEDLSEAKNLDEDDKPTDSKEATTSELKESKDIFGSDILDTKPVKSEVKKEPKKLDEGLKGDFVDITKLGTLGTETDKIDESEKDVFKDLKKINEEHAQKKKKEDDTDESTN